MKLLLVCVLGLYGLFLLWLVLQERINTRPYGDGVYFQAPLVVNTVQALFASLVGLVYSVAAHRELPFAVFDSAEKAKYWRYFALIAITSTLSSPLGYQLLHHVDYLAFLLAKLCKLIPVMAVHLLLYRTRFPLFKYVVAVSVTVGVAVFTLGNTKSKNLINDGNSLLGMAQLAGSMLFDGFTNSSQDQLFRVTQGKLSGAALMCILNVFVFALSAVYLLLQRLELAYVVDFVHNFPAVAADILAFAALGAVGQVFVFVILEKFDLIVLVTATVTRKMISMILSVVLFGHRLKRVQWLGVVLVFGGIGAEAAMKTKKVKTQ